MDNLMGMMKRVKASGAIHITAKASSEKPVNLKNLRKELEDKMSEKVKIYGFIGMEVYDLAKENKIDIPQIRNYLDKMDEISAEAEELEKKIAEQETKNMGKNVCSCGYKRKPQDRFCPNCGEEVPKDTVLCTCGTELDKNCKFCTFCGKKIEDILKEKNEPRQPVMKECICGAKVPEGQFMCLECGRKIE